MDPHLLLDHEVVQLLHEDSVLSLDLVARDPGCVWVNFAIHHYLEKKKATDHRGATTSVPLMGLHCFGGNWALRPSEASECY